MYFGRFWPLGRHLSGIEFGRRGGGVYVRIYDKTAEIKQCPNSWLPALWGERRCDGPVLRIAFELRLKKLREHGRGGAGGPAGSVALCDAPMADLPDIQARRAREAVAGGFDLATGAGHSAPPDRGGGCCQRRPRSGR